MKGRFCMIRTIIPKKVKIAAVMIKRTAAFLICGAKKGDIDNLLLNRRNSYPGSGKKLTVIESVRKKDTAPDNGAVSFTRSTKNKCFRHKKGIGYCSGPIMPETFLLQHRAPKHPLSPMR